MVLIAAPDLLPGLKQRAEIIEGKLLTFTDAEPLRALEAITIRHPAMLALERKFAATLGGAALINCIKTDPSLTESELRVVSNETDYAPVSPSSRRGAEVRQTIGVAATAAAPAASPTQALDQRSTRLAPRFKVPGIVDLLVDGNTATLVDISAVGPRRS